MIAASLLRKSIPALLIVVLLTALLIAIRLSGSKPLLHSETTFRTDLPTVVEEIRDLSRLETASFRGEKIVEAENRTEPLPLWLVGDKVLLVAHGVVTAGVDLSRLSEKDVHLVGTALHVHLPAATIFSVQLDDRSYVYDHHPGLFSRVDPNLETETRARAEDEIRAAAISSRLLARADTNARTAVQRVLKLTGIRQVVFD